MKIGAHLAHRYLTDARFHQQVYRHAATLCTQTAPPGPCSDCIERALIVVNALPFHRIGDSPMTTNADLDADLTASLSDEPAPLPDESTDDYEARLNTWRDTYTVTGLADADYCGRRYRQAQAAAGDITALATLRKAEIDEWATKARKRHDDTAAYFAGCLEHFHRLERERDVKHNKTVDLPCGVVLRSQAGKLSVVIDDETAAVAWAEQSAASAVVYPAPKIDKTVAAALFGTKAKGETTEGTYPAVSADGEVVPGISIVRGATTYTIS